jgi:L-ascorbate metabolism protein UlaG (beta-lactamase superfamily)
MTGPGLRLTWLGHSSVVIEAGAGRVVADPLLRPRGVTGLRRVGGLPAPVGALLREGVDAVLLSHLHHDHCDLASLRALAAPVVVAPPGAGAWLAGHGVTGVVELAPGERLVVRGGLEVTAVPAEHLGRREPWGPTALSVGHLVAGPGPDAPVAWLAGDTGLFAGMARLATVAGVPRIDVAAVPVWGWGPNLGPGHLDPERAADAARLADVRRAVPVHWGTLHPVGLRRVMTEQLRAPGPRFAAALRLRGGRPELLDVGASLDVHADDA